MFGIYFGLEEEPVNYRQIAKDFDSDRTMKFYLEANREGLYFVDYGGGPAHHGFSSMHTLQDIEVSLEKLEAAVSRL